MDLAAPRARVTVMDRHYICGLCGSTNEDHECEGRPECDCCQACYSDGERSFSCSFYPEYTCPGACERRGKRGHFKKRPDGGVADFPTRA